VVKDISLMLELPLEKEDHVLNAAEIIQNALVLVKNKNLDEKLEFQPEELNLKQDLQNEGLLKRLNLQNEGLLKRLNLQNEGLLNGIN
jgi:hypothetical protein